MSLSKVELCVLNNVHWYQAMFDAQGLACEVDGRVWWSCQAPPPFHSNLVVLSADMTQAEVEAYIVEIEQHRHPAGWSLKDSHSCLELERSGFTVLFEAMWIWREPRPMAADNGTRKLAWQWVTTAAELLEWEIIWRGDSRNANDETGARQFPPRLLESSDHRFLSGRVDGRVVAGGIANRSPGVVGISNVFAPQTHAQETWNALVDGVATVFPGVPAVGYERGDDLEHARAAGFEAIAPLRIWRCSGSPAT